MLEIKLLAILDGEKSVLVKLWHLQEKWSIRDAICKKQNLLFKCWLGSWSQVPICKYMEHHCTVTTFQQQYIYKLITAEQNTKCD